MMRYTIMVLAALASVISLAACGADPGEDGGAEQEVAGYEPVTIENGEHEITFEQPPERTVTIQQDATEMMLALGLGDRMVGTSFLSNEILPEYEEDYEQIPVLSEIGSPPQEVVLDTEPDFVFGAVSSAFERDGAGTREDLHGLGIDTYLTTEYLDESEPASFEQVYEDIRNIGRIFGVEERAEELIMEMEETFEETRESIEDVEEPLTIASMGRPDPVPLVAGGNHMVNEILDAAGAEHAFEDLDEEGLTEVSVEELIERDPDVILVNYCCGASYEENRDEILENPQFETLTAVQEESFAGMPLTSLTAGVRNADAVRDLAEQLYPERFEESGDG